MHADIYNERLVVTSGGFDPMHVGHLRCLLDSAEFVRKVGGRTKLAVIVNSDGFLLRKKGYAFMPASERMEIIAGVKGVDYVVPWDDGGQTVTGALAVLKPFAFTKGGDRDAAANVPEFELCERIGTQVIFGVGGGKIQSSSTLVDSARKFKA
jgi:D-beta-D-heptose 7-phosphate kinase/D-beta-D-heptose 1-phosphate adenosyltransferase